MIAYRVKGTITHMPYISIILALAVLVTSLFVNTHIDQYNNEILSSMKGYERSDIQGTLTVQKGAEIDLHIEHTKADRDAFMDTFNVQKGLSFRSIAGYLFYGENHLQSLVYIWFILVLLFFIEAQIGYLYFIFLLALSYIISSLLLMFLMSSDVIAAALPGVVFIITGITAVLMPRARFRIAYFLIPVKPLYGIFEIPVITTFPIWFILQISLTFLYVLKALKPTIMFMISDPSFMLGIAGFTGGIFIGFIFKYLHIHEKIDFRSESEIKTLGLGKVDIDALRAYQRGHYELAAPLLVNAFKNRNISLFEPLVVSLKAAGKTEMLSHIVNDFMRELNEKENFEYIEECYYDLRNNLLERIVEPEVKFFIARALFFRNKYEECKYLLSSLLNEHKFHSVSYRALYFVFRNNVFPENIDNIYAEYDEYAEKNNIKEMNRVREVYRP